MCFISAEHATNIKETVKLAFDLFEQAGQRAGTGLLNRRLKTILETRGPSSKLGTFAKIFFCAQVSVRPPTIVMVVNVDRLFTDNYQRFLLGALRSQLPYPEVPIKLVIKQRTRARFEDLEKGERIAKKLASVAADAFDDPARDAELEGEFADEIAAGKAEVEADRAGKDIEAILEEMPDDPAAYFDDEDVEA